jgi:hypothetical protein
MSVISNTDLQAILDKLARFGATAVGDENLDDSFSAGFTAANAAVMSGSGSLFTYLVGTVTDGDVMADLLPSARDLDEENPAPPSRFLLGISGVNAFFNALNTHLRRYTAYSTLDAYLTSLNASAPTLRVHEALHNHLKAMSRKNVFVANDTVLATFAATGAATGTYTHVAALASHLAGAKLVVKNQGAVTTGATLTITGKKLDLTTAALTVTIDTATDNTEKDLSVTTKLFYDVTNITIAGATNGNVYEIVAKTDRDISAA